MLGLELKNEERARWLAMYATYVKIGIVVNLLMTPIAVHLLAELLPFALQPLRWSVFVLGGLLASLVMPFFIVRADAGPLPRRKTAVRALSR